MSPCRRNAGSSSALRSRHLHEFHGLRHAGDSCPEPVRVVALRPCDEGQHRTSLIRRTLCSADGSGATRLYGLHRCVISVQRRHCAGLWIDVHRDGVPYEWLVRQARRQCGRVVVHYVVTLDPGVRDRERVDVVVAAHRPVAVCALVHEPPVLAIGFQIQPAPATPTPSLSVGVALSVLPHQLYLYELAGKYQAIVTGFLLPRNLGEARSVRPGRDVAGIRGVHSDLIAEDEAESVVVASIGGADQFPVLEGRVERESIEFGPYC